MSATAQNTIARFSDEEVESALMKTSEEKE
jgi:hypothetical protein